jgi:hypothetical protein
MQDKWLAPTQNSRIWPLGHDLFGIAGHIDNKYEIQNTVSAYDHNEAVNNTQQTGLPLTRVWQRYCLQKKIGSSKKWKQVIIDESIQKENENWIPFEFKVGGQVLLETTRIVNTLYRTISCNKCV